MANSLSSLLGNFGFGGQNMPTNALLGDFYDPAAARNYQMKQMLLGMGMGLMAEKGFGKGAALAIAAGDRAGNQYRENALDAYRIKTAQDQQAKADQRYQQEWDYRTKQDEEAAARQKRLDAQNEALFGYKMDALEGDAALRQGKQTAVESWMQPFQSQGGTIPMSPGVRAIGRAGGVEGPSATDQWRYNQIQPAITAGDYETAYGGLNAVPPETKAPTVQTFYEDGMEVKKQWDGASQSWVPVGGPKAPSGGITVTNPDGTTMTVGGGVQKMSSDVRRGKLLADQVVGQQDQIMEGFDALASPQNYAGTKLPGGAAVMSPEAQVAQDALTNTVANWLYLTSGATATDAEIERQTAMVTPTPMDSPQRKAAKKARLKSMITAMQEFAGETPPPEQPPVGEGDGWTVLPNGVKFRQKAN